MTETKNGLHKNKGLSQADLQQIDALTAAVEQHDNIILKLNRDWLSERNPDEANDFLYYKDGRLVGFLPLFHFNNRVIEISGMVHPDCRRQGIFTEMRRAAVEEVKSRNVPKILFIVENRAETGKKAMADCGARYEFSEFFMKLNQPPALVEKHPIRLRPAVEADLDAITGALVVCFNLPEDSMRESTSLNKPGRHRYAIELDGQVIGTVAASYVEEGKSFLYGFCILPEFQGRGYGRQALMWAVHRSLADGVQEVELEVATENDSALNLYKSCGFEVVSGYDYYALPSGAAGVQAGEQA